MRLIELSGPRDEAITHELWRLRLARLLRSGSRGLARLADQLAHVQRRARGRHELEFYAEAGAPEGALYVDGRLAGTLPGITRL
ncbi:hypothetical protein BH11PSE10_BH11PSE10_20150 [soil metagenome]